MFLCDSPKTRKSISLSKQIPSPQATVSGWFGCIELEMGVQSSEPEPESETPIPPKRGGQKRAALERASLEALVAGGSNSDDETKAKKTKTKKARAKAKAKAKARAKARASTSTAQREVPGHPELGSLRLVLATQKSYLLACKPAEGLPKFICEFSEKQVGPKHADLLVSLSKQASEHSMNRMEIKKLQKEMLATHRRCLVPSPGCCPDQNPPRKKGNMYNSVGLC